MSDHHVTTVDSAATAVGLLDDGQTFDLILCELMPGMTGMDFYDTVRRKWPTTGARIAFMTGGAFTQQASDFLTTAANPRLQKPFSETALLAFVSNALSNFKN